MTQHCPANAIVMPPPQAGEAARANVSDMSPATRTTGFAGMATCLGLGAMLFVAFPVVGQSPPQQVISDTPEYCLQLLDRVSELVRVAPAPPPQEVSSLSSEGQRMCDQGQTRGGILRLRRALMLMMHSDAGP
jgi:hypothetical protein